MELNYPITFLKARLEALELVYKSNKDKLTGERVKTLKLAIEILKEAQKCQP